MSSSYAEITAQLRAAYDGSAAERNAAVKEAWKLVAREQFLQRLLAAGKTTLIEIGAGTGQDSAFFAEHGLRVVATDLSPAMVARCRDKGLEAYVMEVLNLSFAPQSFDAGFACNSLLHVPNAELPAALAEIHRVLLPQALLYVGVYGGEDSEGVRADDWHRPPRFFSFRSAATLRRMVQPCFELLDFHSVPLDGREFHSLTLRRLDP
jgi:SAM-dependent methyltransferase